MSEVTEIIEQEQQVNEQVETAADAATDAEALTFDDLDNLVDGRSDKELVSEVEKEIKNSGQGKKNEPQNEGLGAEEAKEVAKQEDKENKKENTEETTEEEYIKKILGKSGKKKYELNPDTIFKQKVDGEEVDVYLQDLLKKKCVLI